MYKLSVLQGVQNKYFMIMKIQFLLVLLCRSVLYCDGSRQFHKYGLKEQFYWDMPQFKFPNTSARNVALSSGSYIPENNDIYGMGVWKDKLFVSIFRIKVGVASSFNYFSLHSATKSPVLNPYPSYDKNYVSEDPDRQTVTLPSSSSIVCAAYFRIDKCDRLWVIDAGIVDFFGKRRVLTPPALVIFDLYTNQLIRRYPIPAEFISSDSAFTNLDIDFKGKGCNDAYAYISDLFHSLVVYSLKKNRSWRLTHNYFGSDPHAGNFFYEGINFQWNFGLLDVTVGERHHDGSKRVYLKPFASTKTYYISNKVLQDEAYIAFNNYFYDVHLLGDRGKKGQIYAHAYDEQTNVLFDAQFNRKRIGCWNTANHYRNSSFAVVYESKYLFFPDDINIDGKRNLWMLTNNYPMFVYGPWNGNVKNIRIYKGAVDDIISGTCCKRN